MNGHDRLVKAVQRQKVGVKGKILVETTKETAVISFVLKKHGT